MSHPSANDLFRAAGAMVKEGQSVFPCISSGDRAKQPLVKWRDQASMDPAVIRSWWKQYPTASIGIPTGLRWDVLDVDVKRQEDGRVHLPLLTRLGLLNGCQRLVHTPSGGWHLYFKAAKGLTNKANKTLGLDVRALGGFVLAPGSYISVPADEVSGTEAYEGPYLQHQKPVGADNSPLLWDLIVATILPKNVETNKPIETLPSHRQTSIAALREFVASLEPGERNNGFHWAVSRCVDNGIDPHELIEAGSLTGLGEDEMIKTVGSAMRRAGVTISELDSEVEAMFPDDVA